MWHIESELLVCHPTATDFLRGFVWYTALLPAKVFLSSDVCPKGSMMQQFAKVAESCRWFHSPLQSMGASCSVSGWEQVSSCAWLQIWTVSDSYRQCQSKGGANHPDPSGWWKKWPHAKRHFQTYFNVLYRIIPYYNILMENAGS